MSLRQALQRAWRTPTTSAVTPAHVLRTVAQLERTWADAEPKAVEPLELQKIVGTIRDEWARSASLEALDQRERRFLPYSLFFPESKPRDWLGSDERFVSAFSRRLEDARPSAVTICLKELLRWHPAGAPAFDMLRAAVQRRLKNTNVWRLREWSRRCAKYKLLDAIGPGAVCQELRTSALSADEVLADCGLDRDLARSGFIKAVTREWLRHIEKSLPNAPISDLARLLGFLEVDRGLRFQDEPGIVADALLNPWVSHSPEPEKRNAIQAFLLRLLSDPRIKPANWTRVTASAKAVMLRWLIEASLNDFFRLLERPALDRHWKYRKVFWKAYFRKGALDDAWVILGEAARKDAIAMWRGNIPDFARLLGSGDTTQSVLLLRIGHLTIAEWSHNGSCRFWLEGNDSCPRFYERGYTREELREDPDHQLRHIASDSYSWQRTFARLIEDETGIQMYQMDYRVR